MHLRQPDPRYTASKRAQRNFVMALEIALVFTGFVWFAWLTNEYLDLGLERFGLRPAFLPVIGLRRLLHTP